MRDFVPLPEQAVFFVKTLQRLGKAEEEARDASSIYSASTCHEVIARQLDEESTGMSRSRSSVASAA
jgi:hypothetical protein